MRPLQRLSLLLALLACLPAAAQTPGSCALGTAQADLATPDLFARVFNTGSLFYGNQTDAAYVVPRASGNSPLFLTNFWVGGRVGGEVRTAAARYDNFEFWPGPLGQDGRPVNPADCSAFDRIYVVSPADVAAFEATGTASADLAEWPVGLGAPAVTASGQPVAVTSRAQTLDLAAGERPVLGGGPTAFWVMNDVGNSDTRAPDERPLGVEVQVTAFAPATGASVLGQTTVYRYTVVNRGPQPITDLRAGFFVDADLGGFDDDYVGSDEARGLGYAYNGRPTDVQYGVPPAIGYDLLSGADAVTHVLSGVATPTNDPHTPLAYYNRLQGLWNDGTVIRARGDGYSQPESARLTRYAFDGDPASGQPWTEINPGEGLTATEPADRRFTISTDAVTLAPGASRTVDLAVVFAQGTSRLASLAALRAASDVVQTAYDAGTLFDGTTPTGTAAAPALVAPADGAAFNDVPITFEWAPVAGADRYVLDVRTADLTLTKSVSTEATTVTLPASDFGANRTAPFSWSVRTIADDREGAPSPARAFTAYRYVAGPLLLSSGAPAVVETTAPGGGPACAAGSADEGCREVGGNLVFQDANSTADYRIAGVSLDQIGQIAPNDVEVRFTEQGSIATVGTRLFRVPFELWDAGPTTPGQPNDPSDDRQLIAFVPTTTCSADYRDAGPDNRLTPQISAFYPTATYADFDAAAAPLIAADPVACPTGPQTAPATSQVDRQRPVPIARLQFQQVSSRPFGDLAGTTIRFYSVDQVVASEGAPEAPDASALRAAFPNPARAGLTVPYTVAAAGTVRLRVVDVLGRTVAVLADGPQAAGDHEARLDVRALAAGVYALVLEAGDQRATRTVTVVR